jgi:flagellar motor switch protein FliG
MEAKEFIIEGGSDYAHDLLAKSIGEEKADAVMKKHEFDRGLDAFGMFQEADIDEVVHFLKNESPQVAAVILAHLKIEKAAEILTVLPDELQTNTAYRLANMSQVSSDVVEELKSIIKDEMDSGYGEIEDMLKGVSAIADILNESDIATERRVLENIAEVDSELADEIKQQMFLFEDIMDVENRTLQEIISKLDKHDMIMGLKGVGEKLKQKFIDNMSERAGEILLDDLEALGPVHVSQVEEAQRNIIRIIQELDEEGEITIRKNSGEDLIE